MQQIRLGRSDLQVSRVAFGTWQLGGDWGDTDADAAIAAVRGARELGINFFDTAEGYGFGVSEELLARALGDDLRRHRDEIIIATKGGLRLTADGGLQRDSSPDALRHSVDASLAALGIETIDLYQVHWPDPAVPLDETAGALQELIGAGKIRHAGVSNFDAAQLAEFSRGMPAETLQPPYHLYRREAEASVLPYCRDADIGVLVYSPLGSGLLSGALRQDTEFAAGDWRGRSPVFRGKPLRRNLGVTAELQHYAQTRLGATVSQLAIAWVLAQPGIHVAIVGSRDSQHIREAADAVSLVLSQEDLDQIEKITAAATPVGGPTPEGF
jgi:aryl-alcohol dehydrogenase-like predicted oxidoreductase